MKAAAAAHVISGFDVLYPPLGLLLIVFAKPGRQVFAGLFALGRFSFSLCRNPLRDIFEQVMLKSGAHICCLTCLTNKLLGRVSALNPDV